MNVPWAISYLRDTRLFAPGQHARFKQTQQRIQDHGQNAENEQRGNRSRDVIHIGGVADVPTEPATGADNLADHRTYQGHADTDACGVSSHGTSDGAIT